MVINAIAMVITAVAMDASPMAMQLHVPLEAGSTLVTSEQAGGKVAAFDVSH